MSNKLTAQTLQQRFDCSNGFEKFVTGFWHLFNIEHNTNIVVVSLARRAQSTE